jgi:hypothetical protein
MAAFDYPGQPHNRKHGPGGYRDYSSFRPWLRDEFTFRCVYCMKREQWGYVSDYDLDHFLPQATNSELETDYDNLLYACARCNGAKRAQAVPDPTNAFTAEQIRVLPDGSLEPLTPDARRLVAKLDLNSPPVVHFRLIWLRIIELAEEQDPDLCTELMGYPDDLPDLSRLRPKGNSRPDGIAHSCHARRERGELEDRY